MTRLNVNDACCEALFASGLQRSDATTPRQRQAACDGSDSSSVRYEGPSRGLRGSGPGGVAQTPAQRARPPTTSSAQPDKVYPSASRSRMGRGNAAEDEKVNCEAD